MDKITRTILILGFLLQALIADATILRCEDVIFPLCPEPPVGLLFLPGNSKKVIPTDSCSHVILEQPTHGVISLANPEDSNVDSLFLYEPRTTCFDTDSFSVLECCTNSIGVETCDTVVYILHLEFDCKPPPYKFCCVSGALDISTSDSDFLMANYPGFAIIENGITIVSGPTHGITQVCVPPACPITIPPSPSLTYIANSGYIGPDSIVYDASYIVSNGLSQIEICYRQEVCILVEDCVDAMADEYSVATGDTICFNPIINDQIRSTLDSLCADSLECQNPLPELDPDSFTWLTNINTPPADLYAMDSLWCFTSPTTGLFEYDYKICSTKGGCDTSTVSVLVYASCPPFLAVCPLPVADVSYQAKLSLIADCTVSSGSQIDFRAGQIITLDPGFAVEQNADFEALIETCSECWDSNENGLCDLAEDMDNNGVCNSLDCP